MSNNQPTQAASTLPGIPQRPSDTPPVDPAQLSAWQTQWANYRWAWDAHTAHAMRGEATRVATAMQSANSIPRPVGKAEVVLAIIAKEPIGFDTTEGNFGTRVMKAADRMWLAMQADADINQPPPGNG
jgi:hypothetical protein